MANAPAAKGSTNKGRATETMEGKIDDLPDFSKWTEHQIGFAPYWKPTGPGDWCYMKVVNIDVRDPKFTRYQCIAMKDTKCRRGPAVGGEEVLVKKGNAFSISVFHSLRDEFDFFRYIRKEHDIDVPVRLEARPKSKTKNLDDHGEQRQVWNWQVLSDPEERDKIEAHRDAFLKLKDDINEETAREQLQD